MEHTIECPNSNAISIIWNLAKNLWLKCEESWPEIRFGTILGCILADFQSEKGKKLHGKNHLFEILITESAHLIWKLQYILSTNRKLQDRSALTQGIVLQPWSGVLKDEDRVLVGILSCRPPGWNR
ncbi:hypothetical protein L208DRAFT_1408588 [Tricholoma matsutake]|nr:hypothetical protein L208DRAFT_1408588 [Tricholoma matsutake 945]